MFYIGNAGTDFIATTGALTLAGVLTANGGAIVAGSLALPQGTNPTVDAAGETAVDTTDDQLVYYGGVARVLGYKAQVCGYIPDVAATDDNFLFWVAPQAVTVTEVGCRYAGTGSTVATVTLEDASGNAMTHTAPTCVTTSANAAYQSVSSGGGLVAGEGLAFDVTNTPSPASDDYVLCIRYTIDRQ
ncbi:MAG: hypothetical protein Q8R91_07335 [Candidatus Omnitrophota bacterium]|nr:hypothetical protein [Candidatus Omnitrophota bacterium]